MNYLLSYCNLLSIDNDAGNGYNWLIATLPHLCEEHDGTVEVIFSSHQAFWFDPNGSGGYTARYGVHYGLMHSGTTFTLSSLDDGTTWNFYDFVQTAEPQGQLESMQSAAARASGSATTRAATPRR